MIWCVGVMKKQSPCRKKPFPCDRVSPLPHAALLFAAACWFHRESRPLVVWFLLFRASVNSTPVMPLKFLCQGETANVSVAGMLMGGGRVSACRYSQMGCLGRS